MCKCSNVIIHALVREQVMYMQTKGHAFEKKTIKTISAKSKHRKIAFK